MASCSISDLLRNGSCFCKVTVRPVKLAKLSLLCRILQSISPGASCDPDRLLAAGSCFCTITQDPYKIVLLQLLCEIKAALAARSEVSPFVAYDSFSPGVIINDAVGCGGFEFVSDVGITITQVARWYLTGNTKTHFVGIYLMDGTLLGGATVDFTGKTPETFVYVDMPAPLVLSAGTHYVVASQEYGFPNAEELYNSLDNPPGTIPNGINAHITIVASRFAVTCGNTFVGSGNLGVNTYGPPNFKFTV